MTKAEEGEKLYIQGAKYREIAEKLGVSLDTVKSWKKRHGWLRPGKNNVESAEESVHPKTKKGAPKTEKEKAEKTTEESAADTLKNQHKEFCVYFVKSYNATKAYQKVYGCDYYSAASSANKLLKNPKIRECIKELQAAKMAKIMLSKEDVIQKYADIAYADISDFAEIHRGKVRWKDTDEIDGTLVSGVRETQNGIEIKIPTVSDRMKALGELNKIFDEQQSEDDGDQQGSLAVFDNLEGDE